MYFEILSEHSKWIVFLTTISGESVTHNKRDSQAINWKKIPM